MTAYPPDGALYRRLHSPQHTIPLRAGAPRHHTVLLVDDEPHVLAGLRRVLHQEPYDLLCAGSVQDAFGYLRGQTVDAIITDQDMPGMRGTTFLATVCREFPDTVRFMLTGKPTLEVAIQAINDGAIHRFFTKPCHAVDLTVALRQALQHHDVLIAARHLLQRVRDQSAALAQLEATYPGITKVRRNSRGAIVADVDTLPVDELIAQLRQATHTITTRVSEAEAPLWRAE